jgi:hypothetical protein
MSNPNPKVQAVIDALQPAPVAAPKITYQKPPKNLPLVGKSKMGYDKGGLYQ